MSDSDGSGSTSSASSRGGVLARFGITREMAPYVWGAGLVHFLALGSWYILRPMREEAASFLETRPGGTGEIDDLWTWVFFAMLVASPTFGVLVRSLRRRVLLAVVYGLFATTLIAFAAYAWRFGAESSVLFNRTFYVFCSVYSLFVVSVFWSLAVDLFRTAQAMNVFGPIAAAGTLGGICGSFLVTQIGAEAPMEAMLVGTALLLIAGLVMMLRIERRARLERGGAELDADAATERIQGDIWSGLVAVVRSPYLLKICGYMLLASTVGAFMYQQQSYLAGEVYTDRGERREFFAQINLAVNALALLSQLFLTRWLLARIGIGMTFAAMPLIVTLSFAGLWYVHTTTVDLGVVLMVFAAAQVTRRVASYSLSKPTKELLFTLVPRDQKYRSKNFIDTVVYRGGDALGFRFATALKTGGIFGPALSLAQLAAVATPIGLVMLVVALVLGRRAAQRARQQNSPAPA